MSRILVVYATKSGCTTGVAERIGTALVDKGATVEVVSAEGDPDPVEYDGVVVGSGIRVGQWHSAAKEWVTSNAEALRARPTAFYVACMTLAADSEKTDEVRAYTDPIIAESGVTPIGVGLFAGWFEPGKFGLLERTVLKAMKTPQGDYRDWDAIDAWAAEVASRLGV